MVRLIILSLITLMQRYCLQMRHAFGSLLELTTVLQDFPLYTHGSYHTSRHGMHCNRQDRGSSNNMHGTPYPNLKPEVQLPMDSHVSRNHCGAVRLGPDMLHRSWSMNQDGFSI